MSDLSWEPFLIAAKKCLLVKSPLGTYYIHYRGHTVKLEYAIEIIISVIIIIIIVISSNSSIRSISVILIVTSCKVRCLVFLKECLLYGFVFCCFILFVFKLHTIPFLCSNQNFIFIYFTYKDFFHWFVTFAWEISQHICYYKH